MEPSVLLALFPCFVVIFGQFEANTCYEAKCDLVGFPLSYRHFGCFGVLEKKNQKDKWFHFHACTGGGGSAVGVGGVTERDCSSSQRATQ